MATARRVMTEAAAGLGEGVRADAAETLLKTVDESAKSRAGVSLFHVLTLGSIAASVALYLTGRRQAGIFVGLWPPTFQALKSVIDKNALPAGE